jgi:hypothetical protein
MLARAVLLKRSNTVEVFFARLTLVALTVKQFHWEPRGCGVA